MNFQNVHSAWYRFLFLAGIFAGVLSACGGGGGGTPEPIPEPEPEPTTGTVSFTPEWGGMPAPSSLRFHFYPLDGSAVTYDTDAGGFHGTLEHGTYRMLAYNTDATGVSFDGTDSYATASVRVSPLDVPARGSSLLSQPSAVFALSGEELVVAKGGSLYENPVARGLTGTVNLTFDISNASFVESLSGSLNGLLPSVLLSTGLPDEASSASAKDCFMAYEVSLSGDGGTASFTTLGLADPKNGEAYTCLLVLDAVTTDGQEWETVANLSAVITQVLEYNGGVFPTSEPVNLKISVNATTAGMLAEVQSWNIGGKGDIVLKPAE